MVAYALPHQVRDAETFQKLHHIMVFGGWIAYHALLERHGGHLHISARGAYVDMFFLSTLEIYIKSKVK